MVATMGRRRTPIKTQLWRNCMKDFYTKVSRADMRLRNGFCDRYCKNPADFPISYTYGGKAYRGLPADAKTSRRFLDSNMVETVIKGRLDGLKIKAVCIEYRDYPVLEWTVYFKCAGEGQTALLEDVRAIDALFEGKGGLLVHNNGDFYSADGYTEGRTAMTPGAAFAQAPTGGRPCDQAFPYQRLLFDGYGVNISIGWPAQWDCAYTGEADGVRLSAGQQVVHTVIRPGETLRTPRMSLQFFDGAEDRGVNIWRRWYNAHVLPRRLGEPIEPTVVFADNGGGVEWQEANEQQQLDSIREVAENFENVNLWWIDAGWYPCRGKDGKRDWTLTGSWYPDPERFPNGLAPIGKACDEAGMDLLVWFEPERIRPGLKLAVEHPEWMLKRNDPEVENMLLDLTNPDCFQWICETFVKLFNESGIKCYRQDFNFEPLLHWRDNEPDDRKGMLENLYVQAYLGFWDYLLMNVPGLWIDSCSSGGRRNDLETLRRSVPLHYTDYGYGNHPVKQAFQITMHSWMPYFRSFAVNWDREDGTYARHPEDVVSRPADNFARHNAIAAFFGPGFGLDVTDGDRVMYEVWNCASDLLLESDFYALTEYSKSPESFYSIQFDCPEKGKGYIQGIRNTRCPHESWTVYPQGFEPGGSYAFENLETGEAFTKTGDELLEHGFTMAMPKRTGYIWFYEKV